MPAHGWYFRASIVEQLPDPLSPLFADLVDGSVARALGALWRTVFGDGALKDGELGLPTVNGYAYYRYDHAPFRRLLWRWPVAFRLFAGRSEIAGRVNGATSRTRGTSPRSPGGPAATSPRRPTPSCSTASSRCYDAGTAYYTAVQAIIPLAASSEVFLTAFYDRFARRPGDPAAATLLLGYDSSPIRAEKSLYDLAAWTRERPALADAVRSDPAAVLARAGDPAARE